MRTEIAVAIKDTAQPTVEEIQEFESFSKHFPKPGTKADQRMLKKEEENIEETSSENSEEHQDQDSTQKSTTITTPSARPTNKSRSVRANIGESSAKGQGNHPPIQTKSALTQSSKVAASRRDDTKLPALTNKTSLMVTDQTNTESSKSMQARHKSFQATSTLQSSKFNTSFDVNTN